jgi:hypothetical protein
VTGEFEANPYSDTPDQANLRVTMLLTHFNYLGTSTTVITRRCCKPQATTLLNILIHGLSKPAASGLWTDAHSDEWYTISANPVVDPPSLIVTVTAVQL